MCKFNVNIRNEPIIWPLLQEWGWLHSFIEQNTLDTCSKFSVIC